MTRPDPWADLDTDLPEPGTIRDLDLGLPGPAVPLPPGQTS